MSHDAFRDWALRQRDEWNREVELLAKGHKTTFEIRHGVRVDTSDETLKDRTKRLIELELLIARHDAGPAQ